MAGVVCCATCTSGDIAQDLKTGQLVGATPAKLQWTEIIGAIVPAAFFAPILSLLHSAYGIGTGEPGSLLAPQAALFASLADGFFGEGHLPWTMISIGITLGLVLIVIDAFLKANGNRFRLHVMPVAVGIYLPLALDIPILVGGLIRHGMGRKLGAGSEKAENKGVLFGSGLIAGEALMGIALAIPISISPELLPRLVGHPVYSLVIFGAVVALYIRMVATGRGDG